jgi:hypothetical protein
MLTLKVVVYFGTISAAFFFGFWELNLKRQLTDGALRPSKGSIDVGVLDDLAERMKRERLLRSLPRQTLFKIRIVVGLKFLFVAIFLAEVLFLQRAP